jgi:cob(I)alamin adenosyltransferase
VKLNKGYIQVYTGDGKGKTTAALGLALRAAGHGMKVFIIQFMKGRTDYGELRAISRIPEITLKQFGRIDFVYKGSEQDADYDEAKRALFEAETVMKDPDLSILILDEINVALHFGLLKTDEVIDLINKKPPHLEMVLTGRGAPDEIIQKADLVTRMEDVKHYYQTQNLEAREGIEH